MRLGLTSTPDRIRGLMPGASRLGFDPVPLPCIRIDAIPGGCERVVTASSRADALIVSSARAVALLAHVGLPSLPILAVGLETATAVEDAGGTVAWAGSGGIHDLARDAQQLIGGKVVVLAGASSTTRESATTLEMAGCSVVPVDLYTTVPIAPPNDPVDAVVFGSPTAVTGWLFSRELSGLIVGAIGSTTAESLRGHGIEPDAVPDRPGFMNTIEQVAALWSTRSTP